MSAVMSDPPSAPPARQPIFNLPGAVVLLLAAMVGVHLVREYILDRAGQVEALLLFAFIPARITDPGFLGLPLPGGEAADVWTFVTYALLHADWSHLIFNSLWLAAFGSAVAFRFGTARFLAYSAVGAVGGALLHLAVHPDSIVPMVGASAAISAHMAGAARFVFFAGGPMLSYQRPDPAAAYRFPAPPLSVVLRDRRTLSFLGVWFALNLVFGLLSAGTGIASGAIAWEAHIGGFVTGLLLFPFLDPIGTRPSR